MRFLLVALAVAMGGCNSCPAPDRTTYTCAPLPPDAGGCKGGPAMADPDKSFPIGCVATLPTCSVDYPGESDTCSCSSYVRDAGPIWSCPR